MDAELQVVPYREGWDVIYEGARYAESHHTTLDEAVAAGLRRARQEHAALLVLNQEGRRCIRSAA